MTIKDIARITGVSITTVSRVINNKPEGISPEKRKYIQSVIDETGYKPNRLARSLVTKKTSTIGLVIPDISNPLYPLMARGVEDGAQKKNYNVVLCNSYWKPERERQYISVLKENGVDGIILAIGNGADKDHVNDIIDGTIPIVLFDEPVVKPDVYGIFVNHRKGGYLAAKHLLDMGHRHIACFTGPYTSLSSVDRMEGYKDALIKAGVDIDESIIGTGEYSEENGYKLMKEIIDTKKHVTAIFSASDNIAIGVYKAIKSYGYKIPDDFSVIGFDDVYNTQLIEPSLTDISQPTYEIGLKSAEMLIKLMNNVKPRVKTVIFEPKLEIRESTKKIAT